MSCKAGLLFKAARKPGARVRLFADRLCHGLRPVAVALTVAFTSLAHAAYADPIRGEATLTPQSNYARLVLQFEEDVPTEVTVAGSILVIQFRKQVTVPIDLLSEAAPAYVGSVRRDPDGTAIRMALTQKLRVNVMTAGERVFIDLLPDRYVSYAAEVGRSTANTARALKKLASVPPVVLVSSGTNDGTAAELTAGATDILDALGAQRCVVRNAKPYSLSAGHAPTIRERMMPPRMRRTAIAHAQVVQ